MAKKVDRDDRRDRIGSGVDGRHGGGEQGGYDQPTKSARQIETDKLRKDFVLGLIANGLVRSFDPGRRRQFVVLDEVQQ